MQLSTAILSFLASVALRSLVLFVVAALALVRVKSAAGRHPMKESTTRTVLKRLEDKGYVRHRVEGRTNVYSGIDAPQHVAASAVRQIIERFCGGSVEQLLVGMVNNDVVEESELKRLAERIARRKPPKEK